MISALPLKASEQITGYQHRRSGLVAATVTQTTTDWKTAFIDRAARFHVTRSKYRSALYRLPYVEIRQTVQWLDEIDAECWQIAISVQKLRRIPTAIREEAEEALREAKLKFMLAITDNKDGRTN